MFMSASPRLRIYPRNLPGGGCKIKMFTAVMAVPKMRNSPECPLISGTNYELQYSHRMEDVAAGGVSLYVLTCRILGILNHKSSTEGVPPVA